MMSAIVIDSRNVLLIRQHESRTDRQIVSALVMYPWTRLVVYNT